jgi:hypothetical protein
MAAFTPLEQAALQAIFAETPDIVDSLQSQLLVAVVMSRENTGAGFFTKILVPKETRRIASARVLGNEVHARVDGLRYGLGFVLFMEDGRLSLLEGYSCGGEDTTNLSFADLAFRISKTPFDD